MAHQHENRSKSTSPLETTVHLTNIITLQEIEIDRLTKENEQHKLSLDEKSAQIADLEKKLYDIRIAIDDQENKDPTQSVYSQPDTEPADDHFNPNSNSASNNTRIKDSDNQPDLISDVNNESKEMNDKENDWITVNKPANDFNKRKGKRDKNLLVFNVSLSNKTELAEMEQDDREKVNELFRLIGQSDVTRVSIGRLRSDSKSKPGPIRIELLDVTARNSVINALKSFRKYNRFLDNNEGFYMRPDLSEAERRNLNVDQHQKMKLNNSNRNSRDQMNLIK